MVSEMSRMGRVPRVVKVEKTWGDAMRVVRGVLIACLALAVGCGSEDPEATTSESEASEVSQASESPSAEATEATEAPTEEPTQEPPEEGGDVEPASALFAPLPEG